MEEEERLKKELFKVRMELTPLLHMDNDEKEREKIEELRNEVKRIKKELAVIKLEKRGIKK